MKKNKNIAIVLAGGLGRRFRNSEPKQFILLDKVPILVHTLRVFETFSKIDHIIIVCPKEFIQKTEQLIQKYTVKKVLAVLGGGKERIYSTWAALTFLKKQTVLLDFKQSKLVVHDAVRPFIHHEQLEKVFKAFKKYKAITLASTLTDSLLEINSKGIAKKIPQRKNWRNIQTPQAFYFQTIFKAYELALQDKNFIATDDCGVVKYYLPKIPIKVVDGTIYNIKITHPHDLMLAEHIYNQ